MVDLGLFNYIKNGVAAGKTKDVIATELSHGAFTPEQISEAWEAVKHNKVPDHTDPTGVPASMRGKITPRTQKKPLNIRPLISWVLLVLIIAAVSMYVFFPQYLPEAMRLPVFETLAQSCRNWITIAFPN